MPTDDRPWTEVDRELVAAALLRVWRAAALADPEAVRTAQAEEVLDALTAAGWRNLSRVSGFQVDGEIYDPRDVEILTRPERGTDAR